LAKQRSGFVAAGLCFGDGSVEQLPGFTQCFASARNDHVVGEGAEENAVQTGTEIEETC